MRISLEWIRRLLGVERLGVAPERLQELLTMHLAEIDAVERIGPSLERMVVGRVATCVPHPDADRLRVATVEVGAGEPIPVVCGAPNVAAGQHVAVALPGARVSAGGGRETEIRATTLRGQPSHGMLCAEDELGLGEDHSGILVLAEEHRPGTPLAEVLGGGDHVLVVDNHNINHRPDLWGHLGWAREVAALLGLPPPAAPEPAWRDEGAGFAVRVESDRCSAYRGAVVEGVAAGDSPRWMRDLLAAVGIRPLGLLVDVTNYVMCELGEPMHAFDRRRIAGDALSVRAARAGERLRTLDGRERELVGDDLVIADDRRILALAGIMGGEESGVADDTTAIVLEAATFDPAGTRRARIRHGLATESSVRFEKGLAPELTPLAVERAIELLREVHPGLVVTVRFGTPPPARAERRLRLDADAVGRYVGVDVPREDQRRHLEALGFGWSDGGEVAVPWWRRRDVAEPIDLVEEVARSHGYHRVAAEVPRMPAATPAPNPLRAAEHRCRHLLSGLGWDEVATYHITSEAWAEALGWPAADTPRLVHPLSSAQTVLRRSLLPTLAEAAGRNRRFLPEVHLYEVGKVYGRGRGHGWSPDEETAVAGCCCAAGGSTPFYAGRDAALELLAGLGYRADVAPLADAGPELCDGRAAELRVGATVVGAVGEVPGRLRELAGCVDALGYFRIDLERLVRELGPPPPAAFRPPSRFQAVERDFTFVCPEELPFAELESAARSAGGDLVRAVTLAQDVYRGAGIPERHKALSLRLVLQADDRTLDEDELRGLAERIVRGVERRTPAKLRG